MEESILEIKTRLDKQILTEKYENRGKLIFKPKGVSGLEPYKGFEQFSKLIISKYIISMVLDMICIHNNDPAKCDEYECKCFYCDSRAAHEIHLIFLPTHCIKVYDYIPFALACENHYRCLRANHLYELLLQVLEGYLAQQHPRHTV